MQCSLIDRAALTLSNGVVKNGQKTLVSTQENHCFIILLVESKVNAEVELKSYLRHLNIPFTIESSHITVLVAQEDCDIEIFRYFKNLMQLLLTKFQKQIRVCAQIGYPSSSDQHSFTIEKVPGLLESVVHTMREFLKLSAWGSLSACSRLASSGACTPLSPVTGSTSAESEWRYISVIKPYIEFVGRQWELSLLSSCYQSVTQSRQGITVYIDGMEGIGKSALIHRFTEVINLKSSNVVLLDLCHLYVARQSALQYLTRQLLNLPIHASDASVRSKIASSTISVALQVFICLMAGVALRNTETRLLNAMGNEQLQAASSEALAELIDLRIADNPFVLIIEDIYLADEGFTDVIKRFAQLVQSRPVLLCITARKSGKYSNRPTWLEHACAIELNGLTQSQSITIANTLKPANTGYFSECVRRAFGHPGYLLQMLHGNGCIHNFNAAMHITTAFKLSRLNASDVMALKLAAVFGNPLSLVQWRGIVIPLLGKASAMHTPQTLVCAGLFKHRSDSYTFQHPAIRDIVMDIITKEEHAQIEKAIQQWNIKWDAAKHPTGFSPLYTENFNSLNSQAIESANFFQYKHAFEFYQAATRVAPLEARANLFNRSAGCLLSQGKITDSIVFYQYALDMEPHNRDTESYRIDLAKVYDLMGKHHKVIEIAEHISDVLQRPGMGSNWDILAEVHAVRGSCRLYSGCMKEAQTDYQQAVYCSAQISSPKIKALALAGQAKCCYAQGKMQEAFETYNQCLNLCKGAGLLSIEAEVRAMLTRVYLFQLDTANAIESGRQAVMLAHHTGNVRAELIARLSLSWVLLEVNACQQARKEIREGLKLAYRAKAFRYIAFLLESKARLLWLTGSENKAIIAINHALDIIKKQSLERFTGSWFSATKALVSRQREERYQALSQGEAWLQTSSIAQNVLNFYSQGICTAWQLRDTSLLKKYHSQLNDYSIHVPTQWAEIYLKQADLMLNNINGLEHDSALKSINRRAADCDMFRLQFDISIL